MKNKILILDDEPDIRQLLSITLNRMGLDADTVENIEQAYRALESDTYALCITDLKLPDGSGLDIVAHITAKYSGTPVIVITAHGSMDIAIKAMKFGAFDFINKPFDLKDLRQLINNAISATPTRKENALDNIIGLSLSVHLLKEKIAQVSRSQAPIFIAGESGSGKEVVAHAIHACSSRKARPFIAINCGAIPKELMESEFFGHKKGSFTGAHQDKQGLFQAADGGTLLLDEIADLPLDMQVKLLRVIQEKSIRPVGSQSEISIDVRILSATHKNIAAAVNNNTFRSDLYYRLNVIDISVPPLREKLDDIPLLSDFILKKIALRNNCTTNAISNTALQKLQTYDFPGNIRELENILERACALAADQMIDTHHLLLPTLRIKEKEELAHHITPTTSSTTTVINDSNAYDSSIESIDSFLENIEKNILLTTLERSRWNRTAAAKRLGISFRSLRYRLKKLALDTDE